MYRTNYEVHKRILTGVVLDDTQTSKLTMGLFPSAFVNELGFLIDALLSSS